MLARKTRGSVRDRSGRARPAARTSLVDEPSAPLEKPATIGARRERMPGMTKPRATMIAKLTTTRPATSLM